MKFLSTGDWHTTNHTPKHRKDDIGRVSLDKLRWLANIATKYGVGAVLQPGDFTDSPVMSWAYFTELVDVLNEFQVPIYTVRGQHDLKYRNKGNTALDGLASACPYLHILDEENPSAEESGFIIAGASYGEFPTNFIGDILLIHKMIIPSDNEKLWPGQTEYSLAKSFMKKYPFNLIVSGDNHKHFKVVEKDRTLINCGALIREKINEVDHIPVCYIYDTKTNETSLIRIPIRPAKEVFDLEAVEALKVKDEKLSSFVEGLSEAKDMGLNFEDNLNEYCRHNKIGKDIKDIIAECKGE